MSLPFLSRPSHYKIFLSICLLLGLAVLVLAHWRTPEQSETPTQLSEARIEAALVTVTPTGFEPVEITRPQGRFLLAIDNRSGLDEMSFYLEQAKKFG